MPLHTDYRPTKLEEIIGNQATVDALQVHLAKQSPNRAILLTGQAGCGKTTIGYCLANQLGAMDDFRWNFKELNSASFRGIDTVREIQLEARRPPLGGAKSRVWLFEECHMWTKEAKEGSLKLLENPPKNCWFIFTTSDPAKFFSGLKDPTAMRRRLTHFEVTPASDRELTMLLYRIAKEEGKRVPKEIISQIVQDSLGRPGVALNVLDKVIDLPPDKMAACAQQWAEKASAVTFLGKTLQDLRRKGPGGKKNQWSKTLCPILKQFEDEDQESIRRAVYEYFRKIFISGDESAYLVMVCFATPYYDVGKGLAASVYEAFCLE